MLTAAAQACVVLALVSGGAVLLRTRDVRLSLGVLLQLLLAAGLLRLTGDVTWRALLALAVVVGLHQVVVVGPGGVTRTG